MGDKSKIEWTDASWNPVRGCTKVSAGCDNCYAMGVAHRFSGPGQPYEGLTRTIGGRGQWNGRVSLHPEKLDQPLRWRKPRHIFVNSMSDLFHEDVPFEFIADVFAAMACTTRHTYQILTKRPERMREWFRWAEATTSFGCFPEAVDPLRVWPQWTPHDGKRGGYDNCGPAWPLENVWLGVSVEDQATANERIPPLLETPAAVRWISAEPLLGPVDLNRVWASMPGGGKSLWDVLSPRVDREAAGLADDPLAATLLGEGVATSHASAPLMPRVDWVVAGGESGPRARSMHPDWVRSLRDQCQAAGVPFFFKQWGEWLPGYDVDVDQDDHPGRWHTLSPGTASEQLMVRVGKKAAGRQLDGRTWDEVPA